MKKIAIVSGGYSSEYDVSIKSGENIYLAYQKLPFDVYKVRLNKDEWFVQVGTLQYAINKEDFSFTKQRKKNLFDFAFVAVHGTPGEDGKLSAYFELIGIPYSCCTTVVSAITFNKFACNAYLRQFNIPIARSILLDNKEVDKKSLRQIGTFPYFVKPTESGSSFGISKVKKSAELKPAIEKALKESPQVMIEEFIEGREFAVGVVGLEDEIMVLPPTEIITDHDFFDYEAKYEGASKEITPADLTKDQTKKIQTLTKRIYQALRCKGIVRIDFLLKGDTFYMIEPNTIPGMTHASLIPQQLEKKGISLSDILYNLTLQNLQS